MRQIIKCYQYTYRFGCLNCPASSINSGSCKPPPTLVLIATSTPLSSAHSAASHPLTHPLPICNVNSSRLEPLTPSPPASILPSQTPSSCVNSATSTLRSSTHLAASKPANPSSPASIPAASNPHLLPQLGPLAHTVASIPATSNSHLVTPL